MTPWMVHHDSESSARAARYMMGQNDEHQRSALIFFSNHPDKQFSIGDKIFILNQRHTFHRSNPLFNPTFGSEPHIVRKIDKRFLPWVYEVSRLDSDDIVKRLYGYQMQKINSSRPESITLTEDFENQNKIEVHDVIQQNSNSTLRSGKKIQGKSLDFYRINIDGRQDILTLSGMKLLLKTFGKSAIHYGPFFQRAENQKFVL